jgi:hypothetical protein
VSAAAHAHAVEAVAAPVRPVAQAAPVEQALSGPAEALDPSLRLRLGAALGHDFARVKIHSGGRATDSATALGARAYSIGEDVAFSQGAYRPETGPGLRLLAHELTHVVQQRGGGADAGPTPEDTAADEREAETVARAVETGSQAPPVRRRGPRRLRRQAVQMASGRFVGDHTAGVDNLREEVLAAMDRLHTLWALTNAEYIAEYPVVAALAPNSTVPVTTIPRTITALGRNAQPMLNPPVADLYLDMTFSGDLGTGGRNDRSDVLALQDALHVGWFLTDADYVREHIAASSFPLPIVPESLLPRTFAGITALRTAIVAGTYRRDLFAGTHTVTSGQRTQVEHTLQRGSTVTSTGVVVNPPMTGGGPGGTFEHDVLAVLTPQVATWATHFLSLVAAGPPAAPVSSAHLIAQAAQAEVERYFAPYIRAGSRGSVTSYHPGTYSLISVLGDESALPSSAINKEWWTHYWMTSSTLGQPVLDNHHVVEPRDQAEVERVRDIFVAAHTPQIEAAVRGWPAVTYTTSSGNVVDIQPYQVFASAADRRRYAWDLFTTLIHEMLHVVAHPNFTRTADLLGGLDAKYLKEGMDEVMRHELWDGEGALERRIASPELAPLRAQVEGAAFPYDATVVVPHGYYGEYAQARDIDTQVGRANTKAAYFLGHTELLGIGQGTATAHPLTGVAQYQLTDPAHEQEYVAAAGDTYASIQAKTNAPSGGILDSAGRPLASGAAITAGTSLRIPGIRWVYAIANDTVGSVAAQNRVTTAELLEANGMTAATAPTQPFTVGTRILIPLHRAPV